MKIEKIPSHDHQDIAVLTSLGKTLAEQESILSRGVFQKTLKIELRDLGGEDPDIALTLLCLGESHLPSQIEDAEPNLQKAYKLQLMEYDEDNPQLFRVDLLSKTLHAVGKRKEARWFESRLPNLK